MSELGPPQYKESKAPAGLAGAGGGTIVAVIASSLSDNNPAKQILLYAAPSISIVLSAIWIWAQVTIGNYFRDKEVKFLFGQAKHTLENALNNENTSDEHKKMLRKKLEQLELVSIERLMSRVDSLEIITQKDIEKHNDQIQPTQNARG